MTGSSSRAPLLAGAAVRALRAQLLLVLVGLLTLWGSTAAAQTITLGTIGRYTTPPPGEETPNPRNYDYRNTRPWWISYQDCVQNDVFVFPIIVNNARSTVEVWVGNDTCDEKRGNADRGQCWIVASETARRDMTIEVPVRNVVRQNLDDLTVPTGLNSDVCNTSTDEDGQQLTFFFFVEDGGKAVPGSVTRWTGGAQGTGYDLVGPSPPADLDVGVGEDQLTVGFGDLQEDLQLERIGAYCVPSGAMALPESDAGAVFEPDPADAAVSDAGTSEAETPTEDVPLPGPEGCRTNLLIEGQRPDFEAALKAGYNLDCGTANKSAGEVRTRGLVNGQTYAIGVAGEDLLGNPGVLSRLECATPNEVEDFFERYKANGGVGGGGFCGLRPGPSRSAQAAGALLGLLLVVLGARRARSRE